MGKRFCCCGGPLVGRTDNYFTIVAFDSTDGSRRWRLDHFNGIAPAAAGERSGMLLLDVPNDTLYDVGPQVSGMAGGVLQKWTNIDEIAPAREWFSGDGTGIEMGRNAVGPLRDFAPIIQNASDASLWAMANNDGGTATKVGRWISTGATGADATISALRGTAQFGNDRALQAAGTSVDVSGGHSTGTMVWRLNSSMTPIDSFTMGNLTLTGGLTPDPTGGWVGYNTPPGTDSIRYYDAAGLSFLHTVTPLGTSSSSVMQLVTDGTTLFSMEAAKTVVERSMPTLTFVRSHTYSLGGGSVYQVLHVDHAGACYLLTDGGTIHKLDLAAGTSLWSWTTPGGGQLRGIRQHGSTLIVFGTWTDSGTKYHVGQLDPSTGTLDWQASYTSNGTTAQVVHDVRTDPVNGYVYVVGDRFRVGDPDTHADDLVP